MAFRALKENRNESSNLGDLIIGTSRYTSSQNTSNNGYDLERVQRPLQPKDRSNDVKFMDLLTQKNSGVQYYNNQDADDSRPEERRDALASMKQDYGNARTLSQYKRVSYTVIQSNKKKQMNMFYAVPTNDSHFNFSNGLFDIRILDKTVARASFGTATQSANFMFNRNKSTNVLSFKMEEYIKKLPGINGHISGQHSMIQGLSINNVSIVTDDKDESKIASIGLNISGIEGDHSGSGDSYFVRDDDNNYIFIIKNGIKNTIIFESGSKQLPHLEAIHGVHPRDGKGSYYDTENAYMGTYNMPMTTTHFVWTMYNLYKLLHQFKIKYNRLASHITDEDMTNLRAFITNPATPIPDIYKDEILDDNYIGHLIEIISRNGDRKPDDPWLIEPVKPTFRFPDEFIKFASEYYNEAMSAMVMIDPSDVSLCVDLLEPSKTIMRAHESILLSFILKAQVFVPNMFYSFGECEIQEDENEDNGY